MSGIMQIRFTKMQGAGNDFVVLDETQGRLGLSSAQYRYLAVRPAPAEGVDFEYVIHNADGGEVEQCGNGARCFARYVHDKGLTDKRVIRVHTLAGVIAPELHADGRVTVDMGAPQLDPAKVPFIAEGLQPQMQGNAQKWPLALDESAQAATVWVAPVSMGNPHAVQVVEDVDRAPVEAQGPLIEHHVRFPQRVNAGFMQIINRAEVKLRVYERGAGETLACGTGACAAVVAGIGWGLLDARVDVHTRGGLLTIEWAGGAQDRVRMTGPAEFVFEGQIDIPETL